jgi:sugar lactone lactonase YvrE
VRRITARAASDSAYQLGEGPVWDQARGRLLWVDVVAGNVRTGSLSGDRVEETSCTHVDETVGAVAPASTGELLVAGRRGLHVLDPSGDRREVVHLVPEDKVSRLNDGACDPLGRFVVGSLAQDGRSGRESLYLWDGAGVTTIDDDLTLSNGLAWSADGQVLFSIDTIPGIVWMRGYDPATGTCEPREELLHITDGKPDGMCIDAAGNLWIAIWGAGQVRCYHPSGSVLATIDVPAPHTSSVAFVGPALDRLLITTAREELTARQLEDHPDSGRLFLADVGISGLPVPAWAPATPHLPTSPERKF